MSNAYSYVRHVGDGTTTIFSIPFPYLDESHIEVRVDTVEKPFTFPNESQVALEEAPPEDSVIEIRRVTPRERQVSFQNESMLDQKVLDLDSDQLSYVVQEAFDRADDALTKDYDNNWDAQGLRIKNLGEPLEDDDLVTKGYADEVLRKTQAHAEAAEASEEQAAEHAESAALSAEIARNAKESEEKAKQWAEEAEHTEVEPRRFSAKHWASLAHEAVSRLMAGARFEVPLLSPDGTGYHLQVTLAGILRTVPANVAESENVILVAGEGVFYRIRVTNDGQVYTVPATDPVADV